MRYFFAAFENGFDILAVVEFPAECFGAGVHIDLFAQGTVVVSQHGVHIGGGKVEDVAVQPFFCGFPGGYGTGAFGDSGQTRRVFFEMREPGVGGFQRALPEI